MNEISVNLVAVIGSPHGMDGNTGQLLETVIDGAIESAAAVDTYDLSEMDVNPCQDCEACHETGRCVIDDDFPVLEKAFLAADGIIVASPNYIQSVTAQVKAMMDRCSPLIHMQRCEGKYGAGVVTSGSEGSDAVVDYIGDYFHSMGGWSIGGVGATAREIAMEEESVFEEGLELGNRIVECIREKATFPDQKEKMQEFRQRMIKLVQMNKDRWTHEYEYWRSQGEL